MLLFYQYYWKNFSIHKLFPFVDVELKNYLLGKPSTYLHAKSKNWHFQFVPSKHIILTKHYATIKVQGETAYNLNMGVPKSICKKGKS